MRFKKDEWIAPNFYRGTPPNWTCSSCEEGQLKEKLEYNKKKRLHISGETKKGKDQRSEYHLDDPCSKLDSERRFAAIFECQKCQEVYSVLGKTTFTYDYDENEEIEIVDKYHPLFVDPPVMIFSIPKKTPSDVKSEVLKAFSLFFFDKDGSANHLRAALEHLLTSLKIPKTTFVSKGNRPRKKESLNLHKRIERLGRNPKFKSLESQILAVKWIGNDGSHVSSSVDSNMLLDGMGLLVDALEEIYDRKTAKKHSMIKKINSRTKK